MDEGKESALIKVMVANGIVAIPPRTKPVQAEGKAPAGRGNLVSDALCHSNPLHLEIFTVRPKYCLVKLSSLVNEFIIFISVRHNVFYVDPDINQQSLGSRPC